MGMGLAPGLKPEPEASEGGRVVLLLTSDSLATLVGTSVKNSKYSYSAETRLFG